MGEIRSKKCDQGRDRRDHLEDGPDDVLVGGHLQHAVAVAAALRAGTRQRSASLWQMEEDVEGTHDERVAVGKSHG